MNSQLTGPDWSCFKVTSNKIQIACPNKIKTANQISLRGKFQECFVSC